MALSHENRDKTKSSETRRHRQGPPFHKNRFWDRADLDDFDKSHGPFCLHNLEKGFFRAMGIRRRRSSLSEPAAQPRHVRISDASDVSPRPLCFLETSGSDTLAARRLSSSAKSEYRAQTPTMEAQRGRPVSLHQLAQPATTIPPHLTDLPPLSQQSCFPGAVPTPPSTPAPAMPACG